MDRSADANWMGDPDNAPRRRNGHSAEIRTVAPMTPPTFVAPTAEPTEDVMPVEAASAVALTERDLARRIEHGAGAAYAQSVVNSGLGEIADINVAKIYLDSMARQCATFSPLQTMLLNLALLAYHRVSTLHVASSQGRTPEAVLAFSAAAVKLSAELRQTMLTLQQLQRVPMQTGIVIQKVVTVQRDGPPAE